MAYPLQACLPMSTTKETLRRRYKSFSDKSLLAARASGPNGYAPVAWEVIQELLVARGLVAGEGAGEAKAQGGSVRAAPPTPVAARPHAAGETPYFLLSLIRRTTWPADRALPLQAANVLALAAFTFGAMGLLVLGMALGLHGPRSLLEPGTPVLAGATALSIVFGISTRRPPSHTTWLIALGYGGVAPILAFLPIGSGTAPLWPRVVAGAVIGGCWVLYFLRRKGVYTEGSVQRSASSVQGLQ